MRVLLTIAALALAAAAGPQGSLVGLYHAPGSVTDCSLIALSLSTGENTTLATSVPACTGLLTNFPSFSAHDGTRLLVAINSAPALQAVDLATGATTLLGPLPESNDTYPLLGLVWTAQTGALVATSLGLFNATSPGQLEQLVAFEGSEVFGSAFLLASYPHIYLVDEGSATILQLDASKAFAKSTLTGLPSPIGTVLLSPTTLLQEKSYQLYSQALGKGSPKKLLNIPNGPGYPRVNGIAGSGWWWWMDFANVHVADLAAKTTQIVGDGFVGASRCMGFPIYLP